MDSFPRKLRFYLIFSLFFLCDCSANDILGCGGFVKSHVNLDFSKIEIGLYTTEGSLKEKTECAPTNGYYFLPLYEKGEYTLKVHPPPGWSFEPSKVDLIVDGTSDPCTSGQDINFTFNGFGITGRVVTAGQTQGPSGISVQLVNEKGDKRETVTLADGDFHFTPVIPGKYNIKASHPKWKLEPSLAIVQVKEGNTVLPTGSLAVKGYEVRGSVGMAGHPIVGLHVLLYSKGHLKYRVEGCQTALLQGVPEAPICYAVSDSAGEFTFGLVPAGEYKLLALAKSPGQAIVSYNVKPESVEFTVQHDNQYIKNAFEVFGLTVTGSVVKTEGGPLAGVRVSLGGVPAGTSDSDGKYSLPGLQPGVYRLSFTHDKCEFDDVQLTITPSGAVTLNEARPSRWQVCGVVTPPAGREVALKAEGGSFIRTVAVASDGKWCSFVPPGTYIVNVEVTDEEQQDGVQYYPLSERVTVSRGPVTVSPFSQLSVTVTGSVICSDERCRAMPIVLRQVTTAGEYRGDSITTHLQADGTYYFSGVRPGPVEVSVAPSSMAAAALCWRSTSVRVTAAATRVEVPPILHEGMAVLVRASHDTLLDYEGVWRKKNGTFDIIAGDNRVCVPVTDRYKLFPRSCHLFHPPGAAVDTTVISDTPPEVEFVATAHEMVFEVVSEEPEQVELVLGSGETSGVLEPRRRHSHYVYTYTRHVKEGEVLSVSPRSPRLLFTPAAPAQAVGGAGCARGGAWRARPATRLEGRLRPAVSGVTVTLHTEGDDAKQTVITGEDGTYSFGPLDPARQYTVTAEKESYVMDPPLPNGDIHARRLAEILVELRDNDTADLLQGGLVSVSGGSYRRNLVTGDVSDGGLRFTSLAPGQYYVKPHMKEYKFTPPHQIVDVLEGVTHTLVLSGTRVAWSCLGRVVTLGGAPCTSVPLVAVPRVIDRHHCRIEEALSDHDGSFRIRGLLPNCVYDLQLKESNNPELAGLKLAVSPPPIEILAGTDVRDVRLVTVLAPRLTDVTVSVYTRTLVHYRTLRLHLSPRASTADLYVARVDPAGFTNDNNPGIIHVLPRLPADNKTYVLTIESSLSKATHIYENEVIYFESDGQYKFFEIEFAPKVKSSEQELRQTSLLVVPLVLALGAVVLYRDQVLARLVTLIAALRPAAAALRPTAAGRPPQDLLDKASIEQILSSVNAPPKKTSKKKTPFSN